MSFPESFGASDYMIRQIDVLQGVRVRFEEKVRTSIGRLVWQKVVASPAQKHKAVILVKSRHEKLYIADVSKRL